MSLSVVKSEVSSAKPQHHIHSLTSFWLRKKLLFSPVIPCSRTPEFVLYLNDKIPILFWKITCCSYQPRPSSYFCQAAAPHTATGIIRFWQTSVFGRQSLICTMHFTYFVLAHPRNWDEHQLQINHHDYSMKFYPLGRAGSTIHLDQGDSKSRHTSIGI